MFVEAVFQALEFCKDSEPAILWLLIFFFGFLQTCMPIVFMIFRFKAEDRMYEEHKRKVDKILGESRNPTQGCGSRSFDIPESESGSDLI